jgi:putative transposase
MAKRSQEDWMALIKQQPASGLTITAFYVCINSVSVPFMPVKATIKMVMPFTKATVAAPTAVTTQIQPCDAQQVVYLQHQTGVWTFPSSLPARYLLEIIKGLQVC